MIKKSSFTFCLLVLCFGMMSVSMHKFYVSVTEIVLNNTKKELQITSRYFVDDLNNSLSKKHKSNFYLGSVKETEEQVGLLKKYLTENFLIKVNAKAKDLIFIATEMEDDVLICYFKVKDISKVQSLEVKNTVLFDFIQEQQHIIHTKVGTEKQSLLLTSSDSNGLLKY